MKLNPGNEAKQLQDNVVLIINGLCESGQVLAKMLSQQGADIVIIDSIQTPELVSRTRQDVEANGRRCLFFTPGLRLSKEKKVVSQQVIQKIIEAFGRLDAFITYSATDTVDTLDHEQQKDNVPSSILFDRYGLTKAAIKQIISQCM